MQRPGGTGRFWLPPLRTSDTCLEAGKNEMRVAALRQLMRQEASRRKHKTYNEPDQQNLKPDWSRITHKTGEGEDQSQTLIIDKNMELSQWLRVYQEVKAFDVASDLPRCLHMCGYFWFDNFGWSCFAACNGIRKQS